jgi:predicted DCC family thiol-disulfide oxidoreductase YuxK
MSMESEQDFIQKTRPTMLWDGDCGFCFRWIQRWKRATGNAVEYRSYQEALQDFPQVDEAACREAVQLVLPNGDVLKAAHAVFKSLAIGGRHAWMLRLYERSAIVRGLTEAAYRFVARNRDWLPR